jgi:competence protein ComEA
LRPSAELPQSPVWTRSTQVFTAGLLTLAMALLVWRAWATHQAVCRPTALDTETAQELRLDLNSADRSALRQLPGVGEGLAARIEADRRERGPFRTVDDLRRVQGIGPKMLERLRPLLEVTPAGPEDAEPVAAPQPKAGRAPQATGKKTPPTDGIDVNAAGVAELQRLPGVGPALAQRIVEARTEKPFRSVNDLRRVRGIGSKTLDRLRPHIRLEPSGFPGGN